MRPLFIIIQFLGCFFALPQIFAAEKQSAIDRLLAEAKRGKIVTLEIYCLPQDITVPTGLHPIELRKQYKYKLVIDLKDDRTIASLVKELKSVPHITEIDVRWAFIFREEKATIAELYLDGFLKNGYTNDQGLRATKTFRKRVRELLLRMLSEEFPSIVD